MTVPVDGNGKVGAGSGAAAALFLSAMLLGSSAATAGQVAPTPSATPVPAAPPAAQADAPKPAMGDGPASTDEIVDGLKTCVNGVLPGDFKPAVFAADGWLPGGRRANKVGNMDTQLLPYGKPNGRVLDAVQIYGLAVTCMTIARLQSKAQAADIRAAIMTTFGAKPFDQFDGDDAFKAFITKQLPDAPARLLLAPHNRFLISVVGDDAKPQIRIDMTPKR